MHRSVPYRSRSKPRRTKRLITAGRRRSSSFRILDEVCNNKSTTGKGEGGGGGYKYPPSSPLYAITAKRFRRLVVANALRNVSSVTRNSGKEESRGVTEPSEEEEEEESRSASASSTDQDEAVASTTTSNSSSDIILLTSASAYAS